MRLRLVEQRNGRPGLVAVRGADGRIPCWKVAYKRRRDAKEAGRRMPNAMKAYRCQWCGHWHLTGDMTKGSGRAF